MPKLNLLPAKKMVKILKCLGFQELRIKGSHHFFFNPITKKTATIPIHKNEYLSIGILKEILRDIELSIEEYEKLRKKI
ncbi:MAG: type II toxin-antitoxin system HicA family toxin [Patescibacteria group bacterium]|nr:type II toxin-antitoxin system HicA family toxin [Patescibacteria group bacterium]